jgi:hypothetical protein
MVQRRHPFAGVQHQVKGTEAGLLTVRARRNPAPCTCGTTVWAMLAASCICNVVISPTRDSKRLFQIITPSR